MATTSPIIITPAAGGITTAQVIDLAASPGRIWTAPDAGAVWYFKYNGMSPYNDEGIPFVVERSSLIETGEAIVELRCPLDEQGMLFVLSGAASYGEIHNVVIDSECVGIVSPKASYQTFWVEPTHPRVRGGAVSCVITDVGSADLVRAMVSDLNGHVFLREVSGGERTAIFDVRSKEEAEWEDRPSRFIDMCDDLGPCPVTPDTFSTPMPWGRLYVGPGAVGTTDDICPGVEYTAVSLSNDVWWLAPGTFDHVDYLPSPAWAIRAAGNVRMRRNDARQYRTWACLSASTFECDLTGLCLDRRSTERLSGDRYDVMLEHGRRRAGRDPGYVVMEYAALARGYRTCDDCGALYDPADSGDNDYCQVCLDERADGNGDGDDEDGEDSSRVVQDYGYKPSPVFIGTGHLYFGVEVEFELAQASRGTVESHIDSHSGFREWFYCKDDGSLDDGIEMVTHPITEESWRGDKLPTMRALLKDLTRMGCRAWQTETCGLHVHMSRSAFSPAEELRLQRLVFGNRAAFQVVSGRKKYNYCSFESGNVRSQIYNAVHKGTSDDRYTAVNFTRRTIELRFNRGTLNPDSFAARLQLAFALASFVKNHLGFCPLWQEFRDHVKAHKDRWPELNKMLASMRKRIAPTHTIENLAGQLVQA